MEYSRWSNQKVTELIAQVRACKTLNEERELISTISAKIRTEIKTAGPPGKYAMILQLLYIHTLGYPTHWAQLESIHLLNSTTFVEKRASYLAFALLLDENQEVLLLATNTILHDLEDSRPQVIALVLSAITSIADENLARSALPLVEKLVVDSRHSVRKKAIMCAIKIIRKAPECCSAFIPLFKELLSTKYKITLLPTIGLMTEICKMDSSYIVDLKKYFLTLINILQQTLLDRNPEYQISSISDPFLQVKMIRLFRYLCTGNNKSIPLELSSILMKICRTTEPSLYMGNSLLYECVKLLVHLEDPDLRMLAINILGNFLSQTDNNSKYVALKLLPSVINIDREAVRGQQKMVLSCLVDSDISIRNKAISIIFDLINQENIRSIVRELIYYISTIQKEDLRQDIGNKLFTVMEKYSPTHLWYIDHVVQLLSAGIPNIPDSVFTRVVNIVSENNDLQLFTVQKCYLALIKDYSKQSLLQVGCWFLGEFGEKLVGSHIGDPSTPPIKAEDIIGVFQKILLHPNTGISSKGIILNSLIKLTGRFPVYVVDNIIQIIISLKKNTNVELLNRTYEYEGIANLPEEIRKQILALIPPLHREDNLNNTHIDPTPLIPEPVKIGNLIGPLIDPFQIDPVNSNPLPFPNIMPNIIPNITQQPNQSPINPFNEILRTSLSSSNESATSSQIYLPDDVTLTVFHNEDIDVIFELKKPNPNNAQNTLINAFYKNINYSSLSQFDAQMAPSKYIRLQLGLISNTEIPPNGQATQQIRIINTEIDQKTSVMKMRISYQVNGKPKLIESVVKNLPQGF